MGPERKEAKELDLGGLDLEKLDFEGLDGRALDEGRSGPGLG